MDSNTRIMYSPNMNIVIGSGIAGLHMAIELRLAFPKSEVLVIDKNFQETQTSFHCPAAVAMRGTQRGISQLGDIIRDSFDYFEKYIGTADLKGWLETDLIAVETRQNKLSSFIRRYGDDHRESDLGLEHEETSYIFEPSVYLHSLKHKAKSLGVTFKVGYMTRFFDHRLEISSGDIFPYEKLFLTTNQDLSFLGDYPTAKKVSGFYISTPLENLNFDHPKFRTYKHLKFNGINLTKENDRYLIGASSVEGSSLAFDLMDMKWLNQMKEELSSILTFKSSKNVLFHKSIRLKGKKRLPLYGVLDESQSLFSLTYLYKNGYVFSPYLAKKICEDIDKM